MDFLLLMIVPILIIGGFLYLTQAPSATGVSSRREKKSVRITLLHCWLYPHAHSRLFRYCSTQEGCLLLTQAMHTLLQRVPVEHYKASLEEKGQHPTIDEHTGQTDWTITVTFGARALISHSLHISRDQAEYQLLCECYATITRQTLTPLLREPEESVEEEEQDILIEPEPTRLLAPVLDTSYEPEFYRQPTGMLFSLDAKEEEKPVIPLGQTLTECFNTHQKEAFTSMLKTKLTRIYEHSILEGKITQEPLLRQKIITNAEWRFLLNGSTGILWTQKIVQQNELGETIMEQKLDAIHSLAEDWIDEQAWD